MSQTSNSSGESPSRFIPSHETQFRFGRILQQINRKLSAEPDFNKILDFIFESLSIIIPYDRIGIALVEGEGESRQICSKWVRSNIPSIQLGAGYCAPLQGSSLQKILETGQARIINDLIGYASEHPQSESTKLIIKDGIKSSLTCPLRSNNKSIGIVFFSSRTPYTYKNEDIQTYLEIADELSIIVERDRLRSGFEGGTSKTQNLCMVLHDLKSPLGIIQGFLELMQHEDWYRRLDPDTKNIFSLLQKNAEYMFELLKELSELSQLDLQSRKIEACAVTLQEFIDELAINGRHLAKRKEISFEITTESNLPEKAFFDPLKIRRVLDNLLTNAVKYSQRNTHIHAVVKYQLPRLIFEILDQGQGIPNVELPKLFREFGKTSVRPTEGELSTGLGLAIAKKIVEQHGGQISVRSQVGQGSAFTFWLPVDEKSTH